MTGSLTKRDELALRATQFLNSVANMTEAPQSREECAMIGNALWDNVRSRFEETLSPVDAAAWRSLCDNPARFNEQRDSQLYYAFGKFLIENFYYWRLSLFFSADVVRVLFSLERHWPKLFEQIFRELQAGSELRWGKGKAPITREIYEFKQAVVPDVRRLIRKWRDGFGDTGDATNVGFADWIKKELEADPPRYPRAVPAHAQLDGFIRSQRPGFARSVLTGRIQPIAFVLLFIAASTRHTYAYVKRALVKFSGRPRTFR
jgi:hypothetical protein